MRPALDELADAPLEQPQVDEAGHQHLDRGVVWIDPAATRPAFGYSGLLGGEDDVVERALIGGEATVDGKGSRHVRGVAVDLGAGVDEQQVAVLELRVVLDVVQNAGVGAARDDGRVGRILAAPATELVDELGLDLILLAARAACPHCAPVRCAAHPRCPLHEPDLLGALQQA